MTFLTKMYCYFKRFYFCYLKVQILCSMKCRTYLELQLNGPFVILEDSFVELWEKIEVFLIKLQSWHWFSWHLQDFPSLIGTSNTELTFQAFIILKGDYWNFMKKQAYVHYHVKVKYVNPGGIPLLSKHNNK